MAVTTAMVMAGCTAGGPPSLDYQGAEVTEVVPAVVSRGNIVSVLTIDAMVTATPQFVVTAPKDGVVRHIKLLPDAAVAAGHVVAFQDGEELVAPADGFFVDWLVPDHVSVHAGVPIVAFRYVGFAAAATVPAEMAYRLYGGPASARVQITGGPGPTECQILPVAGEPDELGPPTGGGENSAAVIPVLCAIPQGVEVYPGSAAVLGLNTAERQDVLLLPVQAVAGTAEHGTVAQLIDGAPVLREVTLGVSDGVNVEIVDGLVEGDQVLPYGPHLRPPVVIG